MKKLKEEIIENKNLKYKTHNGYYIFGNCNVDETAIIYPNVYFFGECSVGANTIIYPGCVITSSQIGADCEIKSSYIECSQIKDHVIVGPFAHIRPNSNISNNCKIGNFVEVKASSLSDGCKASHLAYIGDAVVGKDCNIGCGVIFVNYNGNQKNKTIIGNNCFIGSNVNLIAPLEVSDTTYVCAGTTVTKNTKNGDFVIGRPREIIKSFRAQKYLKNKN